MVNYEEIFHQCKTPSRTCLFCEPTSGTVLLETEHFRLIADTYPIVPGHIMISSKAHYGAAGELVGELHEEFVHMRYCAKQIVTESSATCVFYEHGKAGSCHAHSSENVHCEHFHMHCLPASICIHSTIAKHFQGHAMESIIDIFAYYPKHGSYLFFENADGVMRYYPAEEQIVPSHFLRTLVCAALNVPDLANWESYDDLPCFLQSRELIAIAMQKEHMYALL
ncbi:MAG: hypothetical protein JSR46_11175 [Verrucomicrobia bacterium]|nr:hypothetical protein [Verrucomicrobiota bacterium]